MSKENIDQMRERHKHEIEILQKNCKHKKLSNWMEEWWAVAHSTGNMVKSCTFCGKIVKRRGLKIEPIIMKTSSNDMRLRKVKGLK